MANIKVYARLFPCQNQSSLVSIQDNKIFILKQSNGRPSQSQKRSSVSEREVGLALEGILKQDCEQRQVFQDVAKSLVYQLVEGYNGTIFAYGQTGTGKTYTVEGEDTEQERSPRHGLIPHILAYLFKLIEGITDDCITIQISFLEIYNELGFDLLGSLMPGNNNRKDLPKVLVTSGSSGTCIMHGLSAHSVTSEYEARRLHLRGKMNRNMTQTSTNERSSRSHAIFTIMLTRQGRQSEIITKSKLNIVDLAGSERVSKTGINGDQLTEAKLINLSLYYLEGVIIALQKVHTPPKLSRSLSRDAFRLVRCKSASNLPMERNKDSPFESWYQDHYSSTMNLAEADKKRISLGASSSFVPYRNSLLTMVLQDSLGGNCNTTMIATLSLQESNLLETISTCRFAQRVARIVNKPVKNQEINEGLLIKKLKLEIERLKSVATPVKHEDEPEDPNAGQYCADVMEKFIDGHIEDPIAHGIDDPRKFRSCLLYLKSLVRQTSGPQDEPTSSDERDSGVGMICIRGLGDMRGGLALQGPRSPTDTIQSSDSSMAFAAPPVVMPTRQMCNAETQTQVQTGSGKTQTGSGKAQTGSTDAQPGLGDSQNHRQRRAGTFSSSGLNMREVFHGAKFNNVAVSPVVQSAEHTSSVVRLPRCGLITEWELKLWEMDIQKATLIQRCKTLGSALAVQQARVLVLERHGGPPDELENERVAEQHLIRKQADVEEKLSVLMKNIAELSSAHHSTNSTKETSNVNQPFKHSPAKQTSSNSANPAIQRERQLELRELSTKQKLLSCREQLERGMRATSASSAAIAPSPTQEQTSSSSRPPDGGASSDRTSSSGSITEELRDLVNSMETQRGQQSSVPRCTKGAISSSPCVKGGAIFVRKKSRYNQNILGDQACGKQGREQRSGNRVSQGSMVRRRQNSTRDSMRESPDQERYQRLRDSKRVSLGGSVTMSSSKEDLSRQRRENGRARRPATCNASGILRQSQKRRASAKQSTTSHYEFDEANGFISRSNDAAYKNSNFKCTNGDLSADFRRPSSAAASRNEPTRDFNNGGALTSRAIVDNVNEEVPKRPLRLPPVGQEDASALRKQRPSSSSSSASSRRLRSKGRADARERADTRVGVDTRGRTDARERQLERTKRIRQVTEAATLIQRAYKLYREKKAKASGGMKALV